MVVFSIVFGVIVIVLVIIFLISFYYKNKKKTEEWLNRINEVAYTQIIGSNGGESGTIVTYGKSGANIGGFSTSSSTKFLVVYFSGEREIVTVFDNSKLCKEYLMKLKK